MYKKRPIKKKKSPQDKMIVHVVKEER